MDRHLSGEVEIRQAAAGREPTLHGTILTEGRAASGGLAEVFAPQSVSWPSEGIGIRTAHGQPVEVRAHVNRQRDGRLTVQARANEAIQAAVAAGRRFMSVEFIAREERRTAGGVREVLSAMVLDAALEREPEYDSTSAELRRREYRGNNLASLLRTLRDERELTNGDLGRAAGIDESTVGGILQGDSGINCPPINRLRGFAEVLQVPLSRIQEAAEADGCSYAAAEERARIWLR